MRQNSILVALSALAAVACAQTTTTTGNYTVDPSTVDASDKADWCNAQYNSCRFLCPDGPKSNDCNTDTLVYSCVCTDGTKPDLSQYIQTIPYYECQKSYDLCMAANPDSSQGQDECKSQIKDKCGKKDPSKADTSKPTSSAASSSATQSATGAQNAPASTSSSRGMAAPTNAAFLGNGAAMIAAGVVAALL